MIILWGWAIILLLIIGKWFMPKDPVGGATAIIVAGFVFWFIGVSAFYMFAILFGIING